MRRILAQARKELIQIVRDWRTLALALVLPVVLIMLISSAISLTVNELPIVVQDFDGSAASNNYIDAFRASLTFHVVAWPVDKTAEEALASGAARAVVIIPIHFGRDLARGVNSPVQLMVDGRMRIPPSWSPDTRARSPAPTTSRWPAAPPERSY